MKHYKRIKNNTDQLLKFYVTKQDYNVLMEEYESSAYRSVSAYLRKKGAENRIIITYSKELKDRLDAIGYQYERIGTNINQIAKKVNLYNKEGRFPEHAINQFNDVMQQYIKVTDELSKAHKFFLRQLAR